MERKTTSRSPYKFLKRVLWKKVRWIKQKKKSSLLKISLGNIKCFLWNSFPRTSWDENEWIWKIFLIWTRERHFGVDDGINPSLIVWIVAEPRCSRSIWCPFDARTPFWSTTEQKVLNEFRLAVWVKYISMRKF